MPQPQSLGPSADVELAPAGFSCSWTREGRGAAWVCPAGELDLAGAAGFAEILGEAEEAAVMIVLDLRQLAFIDCSGLRVIVEVAGRARDAGRRVVLIRGPVQVQRLFTLTGTDRDLDILELDPAEPPLHVLDRLPHITR